MHLRNRLGVTTLLIAAALFSTSTAQAATLTGNVTTGGNDYTFTIHLNASFNDIWDPNGDQNFADSTTGAAPLFWGDVGGAGQALLDVNASVDYFGLNWNDTLPTDGLLLPTSYANAFTVSAVKDTNNNSLIDLVGSGSPLASAQRGLPSSALAYVSFSGAAAVPEPSAFGAAALIGFMFPFAAKRRRKQRLAATGQQPQVA